MYKLTTADAISLVRKNFDELHSNESMMADIDDIDSNDFEDILKRTMAEAINSIHTKAPVEFLDGKVLDATSLDSVTVEDGVISFSIDEPFLRLVGFRAADSPVVLTEIVAESSGEGRMQLNPYTRGSSDRPRLVMRQGRETEGHTDFRYYSLHPDSAYTDKTAIERCEYLPLYRSGEDSYDVAESLVANIIDQLTALLLVIFGNTELAEYFFGKAGFGQPESQEK